MTNPISILAWFIILVALAVIGGLIALVFSLSLMALRAWALIATFLLPVVAFIGWKFGQRDITLTRAGMDLGVNAIITAAEQTTQFRGKVGQPSPKKSAPDQDLPQAPVTLLEPGEPDTNILEL